ncbi:hypothetical protein KAR48_00550 [bacterium]|nr:hypothetical protein [bacterium]
MSNVHLILSVPHGSLTATSLGAGHLAMHRSPGSGKHFKGRKIFIELAIKGLRSDFKYLNDGGWRTPETDTEAAMAAAAAGKRTKTALSNNAFSCTPIDAYKKLFLVQTSGETLEMKNGGSLQTFKSHNCSEEMMPSDVAREAGIPDVSERHPRLYLVICPVELLLVSNLTPVEYAWYATHRPGKIFRQIIFTELHTEQPQLAAQSRYRDAKEELEANPDKKTKTIVNESCMNEIPFNSWQGYNNRTESGLYIADHNHISQWQFPEPISVAWDRAM